MGMAAAMAGLDATTLDQTGLAQKGGAVMSHLRLSRERGFVKAARVPDGECDALIAADLPTACAKEALSKLSAKRTAAVGCSDVAISSAFISNGDLDLKAPEMMAELRSACKESSFHSTTSMAFDMFGEEIAANFMLAGKAWQSGLLPIPLAAIMAAIEVNGAGVELNKAAFQAGRGMAESSVSKPVSVDASSIGLGLPKPIWDEQFAHARAWGGAKAEAGQRAFKDLLSAAAGSREKEWASSLERLGAARAKLAFYKDEYEVARLHVKSTVSGALAGAGSNSGLTLHLAPPLWPGDPAAKGRKIALAGSWVLPLLGVLSKMSWLRASVLDPFGMTAERARERADAARFEIESLDAVKALAAAGTNHAGAKLLALARTGFSIKGYGGVKDKAREAALLERSKVLSSIMSSK
jgi:indolepyruvate ferredoxin oxidoreductase